MVNWRGLLALLLLAALAGSGVLGPFVPGPPPTPEPQVDTPASSSPMDQGEPAVPEERPPSEPGIPVRVRVVDDSGRPLPGARVEILRRGKLREVGTTDRDGVRLFRSVPPGFYSDVRASYPGTIPVECGLDDLEPGDAVLRLVTGIPFDGIVLAHDGERPVAGAEVSVRGSGMARVTVKTRRDGTFRFPATPPSRLVDVTVEAGVDGWLSLPEIIPAPGVPMRIVLPETRTLPGRVVTTTEDGVTRGVAGVRVDSLIGVGHVSIFGVCGDGIRREGPGAVTDEEGRFLLRGLTRGGSLRIEAPGWRIPDGKVFWRWSETEALVRVVPDDEEERDEPENSTVRPGGISGWVLAPDGRPVTAAEVFARREVDKKDHVELDMQTVWCSPDGCFRIEDLALASYEVSIEAPGYESLELSLVSATTPFRDLGDLRPLPLVERRGRAVSPAGDPIPSASVRVEWLPPSAGRPVEPDGSFRVRVPKESGFSLRVRAPGYAPLSLERTELPDEGDWEIVLDPVHVVSGIVLDAGGRPLRRVTLHASPALERATVTDEAGRFRLTYAKAGEYSFLPAADLYGPPGIHFLGHVKVRTGDLSVVIRAVEPTFVAGCVLDEDGLPMAGAKVRVSASRKGEGGKATSDEAGRFRIEGLVGETFTVSAKLADPGLSVRYLTGVLPGTTDLTLGAERGRPMRGRVRYPDGRVAANVSVGAEPDGHIAPSGDSETDEFGVFELRDLLDGQWTVWAWLEDEEAGLTWEAEEAGHRPGENDIVLTLASAPIEEDD